MPNYIVKVTFKYPLCAVNPKDALSTVPMVIKTRFAGVLASGETEISDADTKAVVLTAVLNPDQPKKEKVAR